MVNERRKKEETGSDLGEITATDEDKKYSEPFVSFVRILFVVIVGNGFRIFSANFEFDKFLNTPSALNITFLAWFLTGYYFVITDFIFYQTQIEDYPYLKGKIGRFFEDILIFFLLYLLLSLASVWPNPRILWAFLLLLGLWHFLVMIWQLHINFQYRRFWKCGMVHFWKSAMYFFVLGIYTYYHSGIPSGTPKDMSPDDFMPSIIVWVWIVAILIVISNTKRLHTLSQLGSSGSSGRITGEPEL